MIVRPIAISVASSGALGVPSCSVVGKSFTECHKVLTVADQTFFIFRIYNAALSVHGIDVLMNAADGCIVAHVRLAQSTFHIGKNQVNDPKIRTRLGVMSSNLSMFH